MVRHEFSNFAIEYNTEVTEDNYHRQNLRYEGPEGSTTLQSYFFCLMMAQDLTSTNEAKVREALKWYKWTIEEHLKTIVL